jgi:hypothetical protein
MIRSILCATVLSTCFLRGQSSNPDVKPKNTAVKFGDDVVLRCNIDGNSSVIWDFYDVRRTRKNDSRLVSTRGIIMEQFKGKYRLNRTLTGQNDLVIKSVQVEDAGIYECTRGLHSQPSAHLNVLSEPVCGVRDEKGEVMSVNRGGKIQLSCVIQLAGHCQPVMELRTADGTFISSTMLNDTNSENRTVLLETNFTTELRAGKITCAIILSCPPNDYYFKNLSNIDPEFRYVWKSFEIPVDQESTGRETNTVTTSILSINTSPVNWTTILLGLLIAILIIGSITRMIRKHIEKKRKDNIVHQPYLGAASLSEPPEYIEIEIRDNIHSDESVPDNPGRRTTARAAEMDPNVAGTGIRRTDVRQGGEGDVDGVSTLQLSKQQTNLRPLTTTLPNQGRNGNYVDLDSTRRDRTAPSVYKRLNNKEQQFVQSSQVTHIPQVEDEPHYCNVNRPRLPTPESNYSVESNMDQLAA